MRGVAAPHRLGGVQRQVVAQRDERVLQRRARARVGVDVAGGHRRHPEPPAPAARAPGCATGRGAGTGAAARPAGGRDRTRPAAAAASARRGRRGPRTRSGSTSPAACSSSVSSGTAGGGSCLSRSCTCARVTIRHRLRQPTAFSTSSVTWRPSMQVQLHPVDRPQAQRLGRHRELHRPRHPVVVDHRHRLVPGLGGRRRQLRGRGCTVQEGEGGVRVELDVGHEHMFALRADTRTLKNTYGARPAHAAERCCSGMRA